VQSAMDSELWQWLPYDLEEKVLSFVPVPDLHIEAFGFEQSLILMSKDSRVTVMHNLVTRSWSPSLTSVGTD
jgi:hypothetical protein